MERVWWQKHTEYVHTYVRHEEKHAIPNLCAENRLHWLQKCVKCFWNLCDPDPEVHPQNEEYWGHVNPIGPRACYDEGKRVAETMCYAYMKQVSSEQLYSIIALKWNDLKQDL